MSELTFYQHGVIVIKAVVIAAILIAVIVVKNK